MQFNKVVKYGVDPFFVVGRFTSRANETIFIGFMHSTPFHEGQVDDESSSSFLYGEQPHR